MNKDEWAKIWLELTGGDGRLDPADIGAALLRMVYPHERMADPRPLTAFTYTDGPMYYIGQRLVQRMQKAGFPAKIAECYRSADRQLQLLQKRPKVTNAGPWQSPHQYFEAVDIVHPSLGWEVSPEYWDTLAAAVRVEAAELGVQLVHGHFWKFTDSAHVELRDWREFRVVVGHARPTPEQLAGRFAQVLPAVWRDRPR